jgi:hsp70-interacting protein
MSVNVHGEMRNSINILLDTEKDEEDYLHAFDVIAEFVDNIDFANDFQKLGGFMVIESGLLSPYNTVKCRTADLIGTLVQNNPFCQNKFIEYPTYINLLMKLVETDLDNKVCVKALHAISCLVRENVSAFWKFINLGGDKLILYSLKSSNKKLKIKAAFLIFSTSHMGNDIADMYVDNGVVEILCTVILTMKNALEHFHHELFLSTLNQLLTMSPTRVKDICTSFEDFKDVLVSIQDSYTHDDANYQEERDQILWLIESLTIVKE